MDGFKNTTKTCYSMGGYAKGGPKGAAKISRVMGEFKSGTLHSGSKKGPEVTNPKQAVAIALSEARKAGAKIPVKKNMGGKIETRDEMNRRTVETPSRALTSEEVKAMRKTMMPKKAVPPVNRAPLIQPRKMSPLDRRTMEEPSAPYKKGGAAKKPMAVRSKSSAQKYKSAMAARPSREPRIPPSTLNAVKTAISDAITSAVPAQAMAPAAPEMPPMAMGAPAMKKGGKVMRKADGGMASSIRPAKDYNASDKDFVGARAAQLSKMVGKAKGGMADLKQDKAMVKAAVHKHERAMHPGKPMTKLRKGGMAC